MASKYLTHGPKANARRATSQANGAPVAGRAVAGKASRKQAASLERRMRDYSLSMDTKNASAGGTQQRKDSGGFHRPGSYSK